MATSAPTRFCTDYSKRVSKCQKCKMQLEKGIRRMGKIVPNFFLAAKDSSKPPPDMKQYFHTNCLFEMLFKARPTTKVIDDIEEIEGFEDLNAEDQDEIKKLVKELAEKRSKDGPAEPKTPKKTPAKKKETSEEKGETSATPSRKRKNEEVEKNKKPVEFDEESAYNSFYKFVQVRSIIKDLSSDQEKSGVVSSMLQKKKFDGDLCLWLTFLIPDSDPCEYNVNDEQLVKYFSKILDTDEAKIQKYVTKSGDVALSIGHALEKKVKNEKSGWSMQKVQRFLQKLAGLNEDDSRLNHFKFAAKRMSPEELEVLIRMIRKETDMEADASTILKGVNAKAPKVFEQKKSLEVVVDKYYNGGFDEKKTSSAPKKKAEEPKSKKSRKQESDSEESEVEVSDSESDNDVASDSDTDGEEEISGSDSDDVSEISSDEEDSSFKENTPKKVARGTKTRPRGNDGNLVKKEKCPPEMEACRYGEACYRKNTEHREKFWHPTK